MWRFLLLLALFFASLIEPHNLFAIASPTPPLIDPHGPPPRLPEEIAAPAPAPALAVERERLQKFVLAFLEAASGPDVEPELKFFAHQVSYLDRMNLTQEDLRRAFTRKRERWPHRHFTLHGPLKIEPQTAGRVQVTAPIRYELQHGQEHASGKVSRIFLLQRSAPNDFKIIGLSEREAGS